MKSEKEGEWRAMCLDICKGIKFVWWQLLRVKDFGFGASIFRLVKMCLQKKTFSLQGEFGCMAMFHIMRNIFGCSCRLSWGRRKICNVYRWGYKNHGTLWDLLPCNIIYFNEILVLLAHNQKQILTYMHHYLSELMPLIS